LALDEEALHEPGIGDTALDESRPDGHIVGKAASEIIEHGDAMPTLQ
jgi:hypothetical protein